MQRWFSEMGGKRKKQRLTQMEKDKEEMRTNENGRKPRRIGKERRQKGRQ